MPLRAYPAIWVSLAGWPTGEASCKPALPVSRDHAGRRCVITSPRSLHSPGPQAPPRFVVWLTAYQAARANALSFAVLFSPVFYEASGTSARDMSSATPVETVSPPFGWLTYQYSKDTWRRPSSVVRRQDLLDSRSAARDGDHVVIGWLGAWACSLCSWRRRCRLFSC
jgi:hypothetical protein